MAVFLSRKVAGTYFANVILNGTDGGRAEVGELFQEPRPEVRGQAEHIGADEYLTFHGTGTVAKDDLLTALRKNKREVLS